MLSKMPGGSCVIAKSSLRAVFTLDRELKRQGALR